MERVMSVEEKIRRAEEIYEKRRQSDSRPVAKVTVNDKKDIKLIRKMIIQILVCVAIYLVIYTINNNQYVFSEDFINKVNEMLSYDTNFVEIYKQIKESIKQYIPKSENITPENSIGGAEDNLIENVINNMHEDVSKIKEVQKSNSDTNTKNLSQEEIDILNIKNTTSFIKPIEGIISSKFGQRESATGSVPKNHTGTDIAAAIETKIKSATDGEVVLESEKGDYRKALKNSNR